MNLTGAKPRFVRSLLIAAMTCSSAVVGVTACATAGDNTNAKVKVSSRMTRAFFMGASLWSFVATQHATTGRRCPWSG